MDSNKITLIKDIAHKIQRIISSLRKMQIKVRTLAGKTIELIVDDK